MGFLLAQGHGSPLEVDHRCRLSFRTFPALYMPGTLTVFGPSHIRFEQKMVWHCMLGIDITLQVRTDTGTRRSISMRQNGTSL